MSLENWYIRCIKDYLVSAGLMVANDYSEIVLNESDDTFKIVIYAFKNSKPSTMKGNYSVEKDYLNLKFKNAIWRVKI